jgi:eukaryotic-like serine/threonine-protein kinase
MSPPAGMTDPIATRLSQALKGSYTVEGEIGRGGMGVVYHARDERLKRKVAIKVLPPELAFREDIRLRFLREAETAARLSHPHIVPIHSVGEGPDGIVYFVMAYVDGEPLGARLKRRNRLGVEEARRIMMEVADALGAAHQFGIIHRDVKPDNILLEGPRGRAMVTDFGIAKALSSATGGGTLTATGVAIGTPHYMSPEQAAGDREIDGRSDIYSLGVVGYQMVTGRLPFEAPTVPGILMKQITEIPASITELRPDCPEELAGCVMRSLEKEPEGRWPTADALRRGLESRSTAPYRPPRPSTRRAQTRLPLPGAFSGRAPGPDAGHRAELRVRQARRRGTTDKPGGEPAIVAKTRSGFVSWASVCGGLLVLDLIQGGGLGWALWPTAMWGGFGVLPQFWKLWNAGYSWRDVLHRPAAADAAESRLGGGVGGGGTARPLELPAATTDEFGSQVPAVDQARSDRRAILRIVEKLPKSERKMLPDIPATVDALLQRAETLARTLATVSGGVDQAHLARVEERIDATRRQSESDERERQLGLLLRNRQALTDLLGRRRRIEEQIDSCVLAMQNVRFDLLRLKSAGVEAVLDDLTHATQQARALSRDVDHVIAAAGEIREVLGEKPPA